MKQTAVEFLIEQIKSKADNLPTNTKENRMVKGIYVDCLIMARQAKENEKQQHKQTWFESTSQFANESEMLYKKDFEQYYNETFKNK